MAINAVHKSKPEPVPEPEPKQTVGQYASAKSQKAQEIEVEETNKLKESQFKASHTLFIGFLLWILCVDLNTPRHDCD